MADQTRATAGTIALLTLISILGQLSIGLYTPSLPSLAQALGAGAGEIKLTMTVFLASFAVAQLFWGAFSDRFGRRPILFAGVIVYLAGTIICLTAGSVGILIAGRFIQGIGACVGITISRASERLKAVAASAADSRALGCAEGRPLLEITRIAYDLEDRPVEHRVSRCLTEAFHYSSELG